VKTGFRYVVVINDVAEIAGGTEKVAVTTAIALADAGYRVGFFAGKGPVDPQFAKNSAIRVRCLEQLRIFEDPNRKAAMLRLMWNQVAADELRTFLADYPVAETIVHVHDTHTILSGSVFAVLRELGYTVVITLHNYAMACPTSTFYNAQTEEICRLKPLGLRCLATQCSHRNYLTKMGHVARLASMRFRAGIPAGLKNVICVSDFSRRIMRPFLADDALVEVVRNPVDVTREPRVDVAGNENFVYIGRLVPEKNPVFWARATAAAGVKAVFVGDGMLKEEVLAANPSARITGWVRPEEVAVELRQARAVGMVSRWYEGMPLVVADAQSRGVPIITSDACASVDAVEDGVTGYVFRSDDQGDLEDKITSLLDARIADRQGKAAYDGFWANPSLMEDHIRNLTAFYARAHARSQGS